MNLPYGKPIKTGVFIKKGTLDVILSLMTHKLTGYVCFTLYSEGFEEGIVVLDSGKPVASSYEIFSQGREYLAEEALKRVLKMEGNIIFDVFSVERDQLEMILAFNQKSVFKAIPDEKSLRKLCTISIKEEKVEEEITREKVLRKYGIKGE